MQDEQNILFADIKSVGLKNKPEAQPILSDIQFGISPGDITAIVGNNGAGKTTFLNCITRLTDLKQFNEKAEIYFRNQKLSGIKQSAIEKWRREKIGFVPQDAQNAFDPLKKIKYYFRNQEDKPEKINELFEYFLLSDSEIVMNSYPHQLSGGMAQRILLILGLLKQPDLIILDEPNSAVDIPISNLISAGLKLYAGNENKAVLFITQDTNFAVNTASKIYVLKNSYLTEYENISDAANLEKFMMSQIPVSNDEQIN